MYIKTILQAEEETAENFDKNCNMFYNEIESTGGKVLSLTPMSVNNKLAAVFTCLTPAQLNRLKFINNQA